MTVKVADVRANLNENIAYAARIIGRSKARRDVFAEIYRGPKQVKTVDDIAERTGLSRVRVLQEGGKLAGNGIVEQVKVGGRVAYRKDKTYVHHKVSVLELVDHPEKRTKYPTKQEPRMAGQTAVQINVPRSHPLPQEVTVDDVQSFGQLDAPGVQPGASLSTVPESRIKRFLQRVIGEPYEFKDWGGEKNDLYTNKLRFRGSRRTAAFAIKGKGTQGTLTPKKMGKNGDQIGRLASSEAQLYFVVYHGKVDQSIHEQLRAYAIGRSLGGNRLYYCVIDGQDLARLVVTYANEFRAAARL